MITKEKMDFATKQIVENCLKAKKGEKACLVTDNETKHIGIPIADRLRLVTGDVKIFIMEDFGSRPTDGSNPLKFPKEIEECMLNADVSVYAAQGKKGELQTFRKPMIGTVSKNKKLRHAHMIGITNRLIETGMAVDYAKVADISKKVYDIVTKSKKISVKTALGTDFCVVINSQWKWGNDDGFIKQGQMGNLPAGEVFTCPQNVNGKIIVDGVLGDYMLAKFGIIKDTPVILDIREGYVKSVSCKNKELEKEINEYITKCENANRIGEFAIGTNIGLKEFVGNLLQDEKFPGVHIAVGDSLSEHTGADWKSDVHMDMVIQKTTIEVDGKTIMKDGKFLL